MRKTLLAALCATLLLAAPAAAQQMDYEGTLNASSTTFAWDGGPGSGFTYTSSVANNVPCDTPGLRDCEYLLLNVQVGGDLTLTIDGQEDTLEDIDVHLYQSNASGEAGKLVVEGTSPEPDEKISKARLPAGYYLAMMDYYLGAGTYKGTVAFKPSGATPPGGGGGGGGATDAPPQATIAKIAKSVKAKKLKTFKGTATDDKGVARVEVGVLQLKGKKCKQLDAKGKFVAAQKCTEPTAFMAAKGTTSWTFKVRKRFPKGKYVLFARAVDTSGQSQGGFGPANRRSFKVK